MIQSFIRPTYHALRQSTVLWQCINAPARLRYLRQRPPLCGKEENLVRALSEDGIAIGRTQDLFPSEVLQELTADAGHRWMAPDVQREAAAIKIASGPRGRKDQFLVDLWRQGRTLDLTSPFHLLSVSDPVLSVVNTYLGMFAKFRDFALQATIPVPVGMAPFSSQRWHADPDDRRMVKVFLYLNDVDTAAGPFTYIRSSHAGGKWRELFGYDPAKGRHPDPEFIRRHIPPQDLLVATGGAGTLIFCDTSGIHRGGYATGTERLMYTSVYTTRASALPRRYAVSGTAERAAAAFSPAARYAISTAL